MEEPEDDDYEDCESGPSLAMPPLYVLRTADGCPKCGESMYVYTLGCAGLIEPDDPEPINVFFFLHVIESLPAEVLSLLTDKCPGYRFDREKRSSRPYLMNHCRCGAKLNDNFLRGGRGAAFNPDTPAGYNAIRPFLLPVDESVPVESSYSLGGDEFMDFSNVEPW